MAWQRPSFERGWVFTPEMPLGDIMPESGAYKYRLTITFSSTREWQIGVQTSQIGKDIARELVKNTGDVQTVCLILEKTSELQWMRRGHQFQN
jgi:hypothetical protein